MTNVSDVTSAFWSFVKDAATVRGGGDAIKDTATFETFRNAISSADVLALSPGELLQPGDAIAASAMPGGTVWDAAARRYLFADTESMFYGAIALMSDHGAPDTVERASHLAWLKRCIDTIHNYLDVESLSDDIESSLTFGARCRGRFF